MKNVQMETAHKRIIARVPAVLLIVAVAAVLCLRFLIAGVPPNGDARDHVHYQYNFSRQFWNGDLYPRWLAEADKGYGSPIFLVQYPFPYFVTALLRPILPFAPTDNRESHELGVYCFLMLAGAGLASFYWFKSRYSQTASEVSAIAYMSLPYLLGVVLYDRMAIGELATFVWMPLLLGLCDRASPRRLYVLSGIAVVFALLLMSNILTAILFTPVLILYLTASERRTALWVLFACMFGVCLAAVYVVPALSYQRLFIPSATIVHRPLAELGRNLLYVSSAELHSRRIAVPIILGVVCLCAFVARQIGRSAVGFTARVGILLSLGLGLTMLIPDLGPRLIALARLKVSGYESYKYYSMSILFTALFAAALGWLAYSKIADRPARPQERILLVVSCCSFVFMLPWTAIIWRVVPRTDILQYPWRLCSILTVAVAGLFAAGIDSCLREGAHREKPSALRILTWAAIITVAAGAFIWRIDTEYRRFDSPRVNVSRWMDPMYFAFVPPSKIYAFARRAGTSPDSDYVESTPVPPGVSAEYTTGQGTVSVNRITPEKLLVSAECRSDCRVQLGQLYLPLWRILPVNGSPDSGETLGSSGEDLIEVSLTPGQHKFWLVFDAGLPVKVGGFLSLGSILILAAGLGIGRLRGKKANTWLGGQASRGEPKTELTTHRMLRLKDIAERSAFRFLKFRARLNFFVKKHCSLIVDTSRSETRE